MIKYLGLILIATGFIRYYLPNERKKELSDMNLPNNIDYLILLFEIFIGFILILDLFNKQITLIILLLFMIIGTIFILVNNFHSIKTEFNQIWTYQPTAMSVVLHFTYIIILNIIIINIIKNYCFI